MADVESDVGQGRFAGRNAAERLLAAIGYPERIPNTDVPFTIRVDGKEMLVEETAGRLILSATLTEDDSLLPTLSVYATGRMLREDAILTYGRRGPEAGKGAAVFLWQDVAADAGGHALTRLFETFADSYDWWRARVEERSGSGDAVEISEAVIRP